jgi:hypothetical protein
MALRTRLLRVINVTVTVVNTAFPNSYMNAATGTATATVVGECKFATLMTIRARTQHSGLAIIGQPLDAEKRVLPASRTLGVNLATETASARFVRCVGNTTL